MRRFALLTAVVFAVGCADEITRPATDSAEFRAAPANRVKVHFWLTLLHNNDGESELGG
jgi:hypothetical protein